MAPEMEFTDFIDFFNRWPEERKKMQNIMESDLLVKEQRDILGAMIFIIDAVGPSDLGL